MTNLVTHLSDEERSYLRRMFAEAADLVSPEHDYVELDSPGFGRELLLSALAQMQSELVASDGRYTLRFKVQVVDEGPAAVRRLRLSVPVVMDHQGVERSARIRPREGEVLVCDPSGRLQEPQVLDLSRTGVALCESSPAVAEPGTRLTELLIRLPAGERVRAAGRVVRVEHAPQGHRLALEFEDLAEEGRAALQRYVFDRYAPH